MLNWKANVEEQSRKNVQALYQAFQKFITENHKSQFSYDQKIRKQWQSFKQVIQADPTDVQAHNKYVNLLKGTAITTLNIDRTAIGKRLMQNQAIAPILMQINRTKLQDMAKKACRIINKNTKYLSIN